MIAKSLRAEVADLTREEEEEEEEEEKVKNVLPKEKNKEE